MTPVVATVLGLFFWMWSHEARHAYEERGRKVSMFIWVVGSIIASVLLLTTVVITATVFLAFMSGASLLTTQPDP